MALLKINKVLRNKETGAEYQIYSSHLYGKGVKTAEFMGVTSGQSLITLSQINMEYFEIVNK